MGKEVRYIENMLCAGFVLGASIYKEQRKEENKQKKAE